MVLAQVDGVTDVAIIGVPHPDFGEAVVAIIPPNRPDLVTTAIHAAAMEKPALFKRPTAIHIVVEFPRNAMDEVLKAVLRNQYANLLAG